MEMTGQLNSSETLSPGKEAPFLIGQETVWASERV